METQTDDKSKVKENDKPKDTDVVYIEGESNNIDWDISKNGASEKPPTGLLPKTERSFETLIDGTIETVGNREYDLLDSILKETVDKMQANVPKDQVFGRLAIMDATLLQVVQTMARNIKNGDWIAGVMNGCAARRMGRALRAAKLNPLPEQQEDRPTESVDTVELVDAIGPMDRMNVLDTVDTMSTTDTANAVDTDNRAGLKRKRPIVSMETESYDDDKPKKLRRRRNGPDIAPIPEVRLACGNSCCSKAIICRECLTLTGNQHAVVKSRTTSRKKEENLEHVCKNMGCKWYNVDKPCVLIDLEKKCTTCAGQSVYFSLNLTCDHHFCKGCFLQKRKCKTPVDRRYKCPTCEKRLRYFMLCDYHQ